MGPWARKSRTAILGGWRAFTGSSRCWVQSSVYPLNVRSVLVFDSRMVVQENAVEKGCFDANKALGDVSYDMQVTRWVGGAGLARPGSSWLPALGLLRPKAVENQDW